jgi:hypothetical protein
LIIALLLVGGIASITTARAAPSESLTNATIILPYFDLIGKGDVVDASLAASADDNTMTSSNPTTAGGGLTTINDTGIIRTTTNNEELEEIDLGLLQIMKN